MNVLRTAIAPALLSLLLAACSSPPAPDDGPIAELEFDLSSGDGSGVLATGPTLAAGVRYLVEVQGTFSIWGADSHWSGGTCNGTAEDAPMFPSEGSDNGPVGVDAEFFFAIPEGSSMCTNALPDHSSRFQISTDGGTTFAHLEPEGGEPAAPSDDHTYRYSVTGQGRAVSFLRDDDETADDYGVLEIRVLRVD